MPASALGLSTTSPWRSCLTGVAVFVSLSTSAHALHTGFRHREDESSPAFAIMHVVSLSQSIPRICICTCRRGDHAIRLGLCLAGVCHCDRHTICEELYWLELLAAVTYEACIPSSDMVTLIRWLQIVARGDLQVTTCPKNTYLTNAGTAAAACVACPNGQISPGAHKAVSSRH